MKFIYDGKELITDPNFDVLLQNLSAFLQAQTRFLVLQKTATENILASIPDEVQHRQPQRPQSHRDIPQGTQPSVHPQVQQARVAPPNPPRRQGTPLLNPFAETGQISYVQEEDFGYGDPGIEYKGGY